MRKYIFEYDSLWYELDKYGKIVDSSELGGPKCKDAEFDLSTRTIKSF